MTTMMEVTSHLKTVLKNYQHSATKSLQGPGLALVADKCDGLPEIKEDDFLQPTLPPVQQIPILTTADTTCSERTETILEGETISCFVVGGEKRLCLPQLLNSVLVDFSLMQINQECDQLQIYCSRCTPEQLNVLKNQGILPSSAPSCGLITKTDAERLCSALLHNQVTLPLRPRKGAVTFSVYHECFGKCMGFCTPELYTGKGARCIECSECHRAYSPQQFVCHVHGNHETRTVHWGFDSTMWRSYLYVYKDQLDREWHVKFLDEMRDQFKGKMPFPAPVVDNNASNLKRKQMLHPDITKLEFGDIPHKRNKLEDYTHINMNQLYLEPLYLHYIQEQYNRQLLSSFKPIGHVLKEGRIRHAVKYSDPPVLQNPERVVHLSQSENYEGGFQPNVALAPSKKIKYAAVKTEKIKEKDEVSSTRNGTVVTNTSVIRHDKDNDHQDRTSPNVQKSPESHNVIDSTVSVVQSTGNFLRYNPEIELSTDTDDSGSEISEKSDLVKIQELTKDLDGGVRDRILDIVKNMVKQHELLLQDRRNKDTKIDELSGHIVELEKQLDELHISQSCHRLSPLKNGYVDDTHNTSDVEDKISLVTTSADNHNSPTESREVVEDSATSREDTVQQKTVIASLDHQGIEEAIIKTEPE